MVNPRNPSFSGDGEGEEHRESNNESSTYRGLDPFDPAIAAAFEREKMNQQRGQGLGKRPRGRRFSPNSSERNHSANSQTVAERETEPSRQQQRGQFRSTDASSEDSHSRGENIPEIPVAETKEEKNKRRKTQKAVADKNYREKIRKRAALADKLEPENEELRKEIASQKAMIEDLRRRLAEQEKKVDDLTENGKNVDDLTKKLAKWKEKRNKCLEEIRQLASDGRAKDAKIQSLYDRIVALLEKDRPKKGTFVNPVHSKESSRQRDTSPDRGSDDSETDSVTLESRPR